MGSRSSPGRDLGGSVSRVQGLGPSAHVRIMTVNVGRHAAITNGSQYSETSLMLRATWMTPEP